MKPKKMPGSPQEWLNHAKSDLRLAHLAAMDELVKREQACFHLQQAAEKAIKAVLVSAGMEFPLTHDIEELLEIVDSSGITPPKEVQEAGLLTPEKAIKGVLVFKSVPFPRTLNIRTLMDLLPEDLNLPEEAKRAPILTDYAVLTRYPGDLEPVTEEEYLEAVGTAETMVQWAEKIVK